MAWSFTKGLHDIGNGCYAYLQPDGGWGWSNAGLIVDGGRSLLVDTLFDLPLTRDMLAAMRAAVPAAARIDTLFNTHGNPDHYFGNELAQAAQIVATEHCAREMAETTPALLAGMMKNWAALGEGGRFAHEVMGGFDFDGISLTLPTRTFSGELALQVGAKEVRLIEVGPAHTLGDAILYLPGERTVFTGDILFIGSHPIMWAGPMANWIRACERILALDVETVVPGHGPITGKDGVRETRDYFLWLIGEARRRYEAGMGWELAARDIALGRYARWLDGERMVANIHALYREFAGEAEAPNIIAEFAAMGRLHAERKPSGPAPRG
jgi:glyoxylase-like metal-dependent hydrolase (beta-lactamase superfamily II)